MPKYFKILNKIGYFKAMKPLCYRKKIIMITVCTLHILLDASVMTFHKTLPGIQNKGKKWQYFVRQIVAMIVVSLMSAFQLEHTCRSLESLFLHTRPGFSWTRPGLGNVVLHDLNEGYETTLVHDVSMTILTSWRHFHVSFCQTFRRQRIREEPYRTFLDKKM